MLRQLGWEVFSETSVPLRRAGDKLPTAPPPKLGREGCEQDPSGLHTHPHRCSCSMLVLVLGTRCLYSLLGAWCSCSVLGAQRQCLRCEGLCLGGTGSRVGSALHRAPTLVEKQGPWSTKPTVTLRWEVSWEGGGQMGGGRWGVEGGEGWGVEGEGGGWRGLREG